ncbi:hypothetical protein V502_10260 [Pseudogymnoascus sp. VKM F-4520 (FW-2644)]|nr:hypothetical protein V502_10260 [Pseudogymnoascus sp. VKM F-4520 (FW-2644)]
MGDSADMQSPPFMALHTATLQAGALQTGEQMELLNIVDSLRAEGLGEITALSQLIVCGDQSSGKSSVLEAISGIPFPRNENTCTRFATEVILRRSPESKVSVSIILSKDRKQAVREKQVGFSRPLSRPDNFSGLIETVKGAMLNVPLKSFSKDILRIEVCGPSQPQLTLVDLPGLIHSHLEDEQQTPEDVKLVTELVSDYLKNPRSIILAIVSAKYDINVRVILNRAREVDPHGIQTLGIITKPDTLVTGSESEDSFIKLARNERVKFRLGWHVIKNLDSAQKEDQKLTLETRNSQEKAYFKESNFNSLPPHNVGIESLRTQLSKVLFNQIRLELPRLVDDIEQRILTTRATKDKLGPNRTGINDQHAFLIQLSQTFQTICQAAVRGDYDSDFFQSDELSEKRLCANLMNKHFEFAEKLRKSGSQWIIVEKKSNADARIRTRQEAITDACRLLKRSRGRELPGLPNPLLVGELFREYSRPWETLARAHIKNAWEETNRFLGVVLQYLADDDVCEKILRLWLNPIMAEKLDAAYGKLDELLEVYKEQPLTINHYFTDNRKKLQQRDTKDEMQRKLNSIANPGQMVPDMDILAAEEAYDNMTAYYKVAMKLFMDNVATLAIQALIVRKLDEVLCPITVFRMTHELVTQIAGESEEKMQEREEIISKLSTLEAGAHICTQYSMRPQSSASTLEGDETPSKDHLENFTPGAPSISSPETSLLSNPLSGGPSISSPETSLLSNSLSGGPSSSSPGTNLRNLSSGSLSNSSPGTSLRNLSSRAAPSLTSRASPLRNSVPGAPPRLVSRASPLRNFTAGTR